MIKPTQVIIALCIMTSGVFSASYEYKKKWCAIYTKQINEHVKQSKEHLISCNKKSAKFEWDIARNNATMGETSGCLRFSDNFREAEHNLHSLLKNRIKTFDRHCKKPF